LFKATTSGASCLVATKSDTDLSPKRDLKNVILDFLIYVKDPLFAKYTAGLENLKDVYFFANHSDGVANEVTSKLNKLSDSATTLNNYRVAHASTTDQSSKYEKIMAAINPEQQRGLFGIVSIKIEDILSSGKVLETTTELKIVFKNRKTIWVYVDKEGNEKGRSILHPFVKKGRFKIIKTGTTTTALNYRMATPSDQLHFPKDKPIETRIYI